MHANWHWNGPRPPSLQSATHAPAPSQSSSPAHSDATSPVVTEVVASPVLVAASQPPVPLSPVPPTSVSRQLPGGRSSGIASPRSETPLLSPQAHRPTSSSKIGRLNPSPRRLSSLKHRLPTRAGRSSLAPYTGPTHRSTRRRHGTKRPRREERRKRTGKQRVPVPRLEGPNRRRRHPPPCTPASLRSRRA